MTVQITPASIRLACDLYPPDGFDDMAYGVITLDLSYVSWVLTLLDVAKVLGENHEGLHRIEFWDFGTLEVGAQLGSDTDGGEWDNFKEALGGYSGCPDARPDEDPLQFGEWRQLPDGWDWGDTADTDIFNLNQARIETVRIRVDKNDCLWSFYPKYADGPSEMGTRTLSRDLLERLHERLLSLASPEERDKVSQRRTETFTRIVDLTA